MLTGPTARSACVVAEVHNTYGERHCYLLRPDDAGRAEAAKEFYVSPFFAVDGSYEMRLPEPGERLRPRRSRCDRDGRTALVHRRRVRGHRTAATPARAGADGAAPPVRTLARHRR